MTANDEQKLPGETDELQLFTIGGTSKPFCADHVVKDKQLIMEINTGAAVLPQRRLFWKLYPELSLQPSNAFLKTYTGECIPVLGELKYQSSTKANRNS